MLDARLSLAASLCEPCEWGADIGTDHALLPARLLRDGTCRRMILSDVSEKALQHARQTVARFHLEDRVLIRCADGLDAVDRDCGCISVTGMGGHVISRILREGRGRLNSAVLVLSCHTDHDLVRRAVQDIGWHFTQEVLCRAGGYYYLLWRAEKGADTPWTEAELRRGRLLWQTENTPLREAYTRHRLQVAQRKQAGLHTALLSGTIRPGGERELREAEEDIAFYESLPGLEAER